jgi:hypothetical protein
MLFSMPMVMRVMDDSCFTPTSRKLALVVALLILVGGWSGIVVAASICPNCGRTDLPELLMLCPACGGKLQTRSGQQSTNLRASLTLEIFYGGDFPNRLPEHGKVFLNRKPLGEIGIDQREERDRTPSRFQFQGLGHDYTARYRFDTVGLTPGVVKLEVEFVFPRARGLAASRRRLCFPFVPLKGGQTTRLRYCFTVPRDFGTKPKPDLASALATGPLAMPAIPSASDSFLQHLPVDLTPVEGGAQVEIKTPDLR